MVMIAPSACGVAEPDPSASPSQSVAELAAVPSDPVPTEPAPPGDGTVPWRGECTASSQCNQAAATELCGAGTEMYCKFFKKKDGGPADKGTCECREKATPTPMDGGVKDAGVVVVAE